MENSEFTYRTKESGREILLEELDGMSPKGYRATLGGLVDSGGHIKKQTVGPVKPNSRAALFSVTDEDIQVLRSGTPSFTIANPNRYSTETEEPPSEEPEFDIEGVMCKIEEQARVVARFLYGFSDPGELTWSIVKSNGECRVSLGWGNGTLSVGSTRKTLREALQSILDRLPEES